MSSGVFAASARRDSADFTRRRSLPLPELVTFLLNFRKEADQARFLEVVSGQPVIQGSTQSDFCQARSEFKPRAFMVLNDKMLDGSYRHLATHRRHGLRLLTQPVSAPALSVEAVRPERSYPRRIKPSKLQGFHANYKRTR